MNKFQIIFLFILSVFLLSTFHLKAQVTIGSALEPLQGTLLDLKENETDLGGVTSTKGIILPRVSLTSLSELYPILIGTESDYESQKLRYKGVIVYNINTVNSLQGGIYIWEGIKWNTINTDLSRNVLNGLNLASKNIKIGRILTEKTTISQNNNDLIIDNTKDGIFRINGIKENAAISSSSATIEINGKVKITIPSELDGNTKRLVINDNVPSAAMLMNAGDKIRMVLRKQIGDNQGNYSTPNWGIKLPPGGKYSKVIKIAAI